jgi:threonine/homoserine/homoserine lactone efflux protein
VPEPASVLVFALAALALLVVPGPSVLYIVTRSVDQGRAAGLVSVLGVQTGALVHVAAAALGFSALLLSSSLAFAAVKYLGAAYLIYLGIRKLLERGGQSELRQVGRARLARVYADGALVNVLNPKTALFFFAFLPQFVDPARGAVAGQVLALGALFVALALLSDGAYALLSARAAAWLRGRPHLGAASRYLTGGVYLGLGATALASPQPVPAQR